MDINKPNLYAAFLKPFMERLLGFISLIVLCPVMFLIIFMYVVSGQFPTFFSQVRIGKNTKPFLLWKFRTLSTDESKTLHERRFPLGDFLRRTSLDELPQLWNVIRGEMNLIGPRPLPVTYLSKLTEVQLNRHRLAPGITGLVQVSGRHRLSWEEKFSLDDYYVQHCSWWLDVKIIFKTIYLLISFQKDDSLNEKPLT